jgi:small subunit ribosomal protein S11
MAQTRRRGRAGGRRKERKSSPRARAYIHATFNNTVITFTDPEGNVILWGSPATLQPPFKGSRRSTPYAAQLAAQDVTRRAIDQGVREVDVYVKGPGPGREAAIRSIQAAGESQGLRVRSIADVTPIPHNGCRPPKKRRI